MLLLGRIYWSFLSINLLLLHFIGFLIIRAKTNWTTLCPLCQSVEGFGPVHCSLLLATVRNKVLLLAMRIFMEKCFTIKSHKCLISSEMLDVLWKISILKNQEKILDLIFHWKSQHFQWNILPLIWREEKKPHHLFFSLSLIQTNKERRMQHICISRFHSWNAFNLFIIKFSFGMGEGRVWCLHFCLMVCKLSALWKM